MMKPRTGNAKRLQPVQAPMATVSTLGFIGIVVALIGLGLGGVMILTTSVGAQSKDLAALRREATELNYRKSSLQSQLQHASSANVLALRASELGMVPNPYPAFINLSDGSVTGVPTKVGGTEMPFLRGRPPVSKPTPRNPGTTPTTTAPTEAPASLSVAEQAGRRR